MREELEQYIFKLSEEERELALEIMREVISSSLDT